MGDKKMNRSLGFASVLSSGPTGQADLAIASSIKYNRSLKTLEKLDKTINWLSVKEILMNHYTVAQVMRAPMHILLC